MSEITENPSQSATAPAAATAPAGGSATSQASSAPGGSKPDAVLWPATFKKGGSAVHRATMVQRAFGPVLGGDQHTELGASAGGRVYSRDVGGGNFMSTLAAGDTLLHAKDHEDYAGLPRYRWVDQGNGIQYGYLLTDEELAKL